MASDNLTIIVQFSLKCASNNLGITTGCDFCKAHGS